MTAELAPTATTAVAEPGTLVHDWAVPHIPEAVGLVRRQVRSLLAEWGMGGDTLDGVVLIVSELVTNAVVHALPPTELSLSLAPAAGGRTLRVEVHDHGPAHADGPRLSDDEHGRGIDIVSALAAGYGTYEDAGSAVRWAEFDCHAEPHGTTVR